MPTEATYYSKLGAVIASAAVVVAGIFKLFNSVLTDLMPSVEGSAQAVNFVGFGTLVILLALTLLIRKQLSVTSQYLWAGAGLVFLVAAVLVYLSFSDLVRLRVYMYPPETAPGVTQVPHVSGRLHEIGEQRRGNLDVATAVAKFGGPPMVNGRQTLWSSEARSEVIGSFVRYYMAIAFLMATALVAVSIAVWRTIDETTRMASPGKNGAAPV